jgi:hypothetical protein
MKKIRYMACVVVLTFLAIATASAQGGGKLKVIILIYSGRPNPTYTIDKPEDIEAVKALFRGGMSKGAETGKQFRPRLGYNGLLVENAGNVEGLPARFYVCEGNIYMPQTASTGNTATLSSRAVASPQGALIDEGRSLESKLFDAGSAEGKISPKAKNVMNK